LKLLYNTAIKNGTMHHEARGIHIELTILYCINKSKQSKRPIHWQRVRGSNGCRCRCAVSGATSRL